MWFIIQTIVFSIIIIALFHYLINYIKDMYSPKKTRDLVGSQTQKYKTILDEILKNKQINNENLTIKENEKEELIMDINCFMDSYLTSNKQ